MAFKGLISGLAAAVLCCMPALAQTTMSKNDPVTRVIEWTPGSDTKTKVSGPHGDDDTTKRPGQHAWLYGMKMDEVGDRPCFVEAYWWRFTDQDLRQDFTTRFNVCGKTVNGDKEAILTDAVRDRKAVTSLQVCTNNKNNSRLKGVKLWGGYIDRNNSGKVTDANTIRQFSRANCKDWKKVRDCPTGQAAVGFDIEYNDDEIVGLALHCAKPTFRIIQEPTTVAYSEMEQDIRVKVSTDDRTTTMTINEAIDVHRVAGAAVAIIEDFKVTTVRTYGLRDYKDNLPANSQTLWQAASMSKMVAGLAMAKAHFSGHGPTLGRRVNKAAAAHPNSHLDDWTRRKFDRAEEHYLPDISVRRLMTHTAGLDKHGIGTAKTDCPTKMRNLMMGELTCGISATNPIHAPGTKWDYSGGGYVVAEHMLELASGKSARVYLNNEILKPYGLTKSTFDTADKDMDNLARGCSRSICGFDVKHTVVKFAGGLLAHPEEFARLVAMLGNMGRDETGAQVIPAAHVDKMLIPIWNIGSSLQACTADSACAGGEQCLVGKCRKPLVTDSDDWYGLGVHLSTTIHDGYPRTIWHGGAQDGFRSRFLIDRKTGNGFVIFVNGKEEWELNGVTYGGGALVSDIANAFDRHF
ncbi:serine hydrolase domain-containing protein [Marimonas lutisalis]|uniref:serine hydrolase domain-containing protein n=1 Tax=Marimonas lutisalis TaxID=2545756 RepID=UPI0010F9B25B|nr:serine hydrolase domain-containing protein [Marimonas lutisalis]